MEIESLKNLIRGSAINTLLQVEVLNLAGIERAHLNIENLSTTLVQITPGLQIAAIAAHIVTTIAQVVAMAAARTVAITLVDLFVATAVLTKATDIMATKTDVRAGVVHTIAIQTDTTIAIIPTAALQEHVHITAAQITIAKTIPAALISVVATINAGQVIAEITIRKMIPIGLERVVKSAEEQKEEITQLLVDNSTKIKGFFKFKEPFFYLHPTIKLSNCLI